LETILDTNTRSRGAAGPAYRSTHPVEAQPEPTEDFVEIAGRRLPLASLLDRRLSDPTYLAALRAEMRNAAPFAHLVVDGWFSPDLLELVRGEFDSPDRVELTSARTTHEATYRTPMGSRLGPASQLYFNLINSGAFVDLLGYLCGVDHLMPDVSLFGGGLHETRPGGFFDVHVDFDRHAFTGLRNELVLLTYLNRDWPTEWNGALELWDSTRAECVRKVEPEFGRAILMRRTPQSLHGHPLPLAAPPGTVRRSLASYYYSNADVKRDRTVRVGTAYLFCDSTDGLRALARGLTPPLLWSFLRRRIRR
jgi:2OG-Fe(II) oxygenase superfamily